MKFDTAFEHVVGVEGGYTNNPADNGGETMYGITAKVARQFGYNGNMKDMPLSTAKAIYRKYYWDLVKGDDLPVGLDEFVFDYAVNSGVGAAGKALQRAVGALPDGAVGPKTVALVKDRSAESIIRLMFVERAMLFARHEDVGVFGRGWFARLHDVTSRALLVINTNK